MTTKSSGAGDKGRKRGPKRIVIERNLRTTMRWMKAKEQQQKARAATAWLGKRVQQRSRKRSER